MVCSSHSIRENAGVKQGFSRRNFNWTRPPIPISSVVHLERNLFGVRIIILCLCSVSPNALRRFGMYSTQIIERSKKKNIFVSCHLQSKASKRQVSSFIKIQHNFDIENQEIRYVEFSHDETATMKHELFVPFSIVVVQHLL